MFLSLVPIAVHNTWHPYLYGSPFIQIIPFSFPQKQQINQATFIGDKAPSSIHYHKGYFKIDGYFISLLCFKCVIFKTEYTHWYEQGDWMDQLQFIHARSKFKGDWLQSTKFCDKLNIKFFISWKWVVLCSKFDIFQQI